MQTIITAILAQPNLDPKFKPATGPIYYETLAPEYLDDPLGAEISLILNDSLTRTELVEALKHIVNREVLDKADRIVRRLEEHREGVKR